MLQHADHVLRRERRINLDRQALPHAFVQNIQRAKPSATVEGVAHEIHGPYRVRLRDDHQRLAKLD